jgi:hypothetical protein
MVTLMCHRPMQVHLDKRRMCQGLVIRVPDRLDSGFELGSVE